MPERSSLNQSYEIRIVHKLPKIELKRRLTPWKDIDHIPARAHTLAEGLDHPIRKFNEGVVRGFNVIPVSNTHNDIRGCVLKMCLKLCGGMQQRPEKGVGGFGLLIEEATSGGRVEMLSEESAVPSPRF
jgi:hypothetical protein